MPAHLILALALLAPTDQTVPVAKGTKLDVNNFAGDVIVKTWDKDAVRVEVNHSDREMIDIKQGEQTVTIRGRSTRGGPSRSLDYTITVPGWMAIGVSGTYADVTLEGVGGDVAVDTTRGDIKVRGGSGFVSLKSVQGEITLEKAKGRVEVRAVNESIHLADISGDLSAESTNGSIILDRIDSSNVDLYTVNGNISYDGPIKDKGVYRLTTHNGLIAMPVAERANAMLTARTYNGGIRATFALPGDTGDRRTKRLSLTLGNGGAHVELESFSGTISLRRPGEARPETERKRRQNDNDKDKAKEKEKGDQIGLARFGLNIDAVVAEALAEAQAAVPQALAEAQASIPQAIAEAEASIPDAIAEALASLALPMPRPAPRPKPR
ncbi:MAG: DUF4097 family beta strand repeat protein [Acidobacteria bacterium]|nr:DUF4097 family beta strand repeat protein [Acidobacteriota bacterium]